MLRQIILDKKLGNAHFKIIHLMWYREGDW